jgi:hypothetical protein
MIGNGIATCRRLWSGRESSWARMIPWLRRALGGAKEHLRGIVVHVVHKPPAALVGIGQLDRVISSEQAVTQKQMTV